MALNFQLLLEATPHPYLILQPDEGFTIAAVNNRYLAVTGTRREAIVGRGLFEVFPDNPDDSRGSGVSDLRASLERVLRDRVPDTMGVQKYDIPRRDGSDGFDLKYWSPVNTPVFDTDGCVAYIIHHVEDITEFMLSRIPATGEARAERLEAEVLRRATEVKETNRKLKTAMEELELREAVLAEALGAADAANRAKSDFLANMSHELRTPLNGLLILSQLLGKNAQGNLDARQVEFAHAIHRSGADLLTLINDLLDLAKIEAGRVGVEAEEVQFPALRQNVERTLSHMAQEKGLAFAVELDPDLPRALFTDSVRLQQVLRNLIANAIKFTPAGQVVLRVRPATAGWSADHRVLAAAHTVIAFDVIDSGIGIAPEKQQLIFEAFQQAESGTARKYGGTGLGLSISREIANLLGGALTLISAPGAGSTFTLYLPLVLTGTAESAEALDPHREAVLARPSRLTEEGISDDRATIVPGDSAIIRDDDVLLVIEDDLAFARILMDLARDKGMKTLFARSGAQGLALANRYRPTAITLDLSLPDIDGWTMYERLKIEPELAHIPVLVISVRDEPRRAVEMGAFATLLKPISHEALSVAIDKVTAYARAPLKNLLLVEDNPVERAAMVSLLAGTDLLITEAETGAAALASMRGARFDCIVLDLMLPDMSGFEVLEHMQAEPATRDIPVVVHTAKDLSLQEEAQLHLNVRQVIVKDGQSYERLNGQICRFLQRSLARPETPPTGPAQTQAPSLAGRKVLAVDDDVRNVFALAALLESHRIRVITAESGRHALERLAEHPDVDAVLMDIMMPEMDGYATIRAIRAMAGHQVLPIIALTAKAMPGDREQCLAAGCSDYLTKPVNAKRLFAMLQEWMPR